MTYEHNGVLHITDERKAACELCEEVAELRPYGPGGSSICFPCAMEDEPAAERRFIERMAACGNEVVDDRHEAN